MHANPSFIFISPDCTAASNTRVADCGWHIVAITCCCPFAFACRTVCRWRLEHAREIFQWTRTASLRRHSHPVCGCTKNATCCPAFLHRLHPLLLDQTSCCHRVEHLVCQWMPFSQLFLQIAGGLSTSVNQKLACCRGKVRFNSATWFPVECMTM